MEIINRKHKKAAKNLGTYMYELVVDGILTLLALAPVLYGYLRVVEVGGESYYLFLQIFVLAITVTYAQIYPYAVVFFNEFKDVVDPELLGQLQNLALKSDFPATEIRIKASGQYDCHGAEYYGIGNKHFIGIYESLLGKLTSSEVVGVVCHELGHWHHRHSLKALLLYLVDLRLARPRTSASSTFTASS